jgi:hypothetical protein
MRAALQRCQRSGGVLLIAREHRLSLQLRYGLTDCALHFTSRNLDPRFSSYHASNDVAIRRYEPPAPERSDI